MNARYSLMGLRDALLRGEEPAPAEFLTSRFYYPWLVVGTVCIGAFIGQVDASIVQLALPTLEREFDARLHVVSWVAVGYVLAFASILPVFARLAEIMGRKLMYLVGFALFGLTSLLCGFAPNLHWLIGCRILQGVSGAMLGANSVATLVAATGPAKKGRGMGIMAAAQAIGVSSGPSLGGLLLGWLGWRWVFWVTVPFSLAGAVIGWFVVPKTAKLSSDRSFDWGGALLLTPALTALMMAIMEAHAWGPLSEKTLVCITGAVALLCAFVWKESVTRPALLDLNLFRARAFTGGIIATVLSYAMLYGMFFSMSFCFVRGYHASPLEAGLRLTVVPLALGIVAPFSGTIYERHPRLASIGGMALCVAAIIALNTMLTGSANSLLGVMIALAIFGAGLGLFIAPNNSATISAAPAAKSGQAGGLMNLMRVLGTGLGIASASTLLSWRLEHATGTIGQTVAVSESALLASVGDVLLMLAIFAVTAGAAAQARRLATVGPA
jgi:EmrB/QacA subfamily drug resistance transporter